MVASLTVDIDATKHKVSAVTVFQGRAEVIREFRLEVESGQTVVELSNLPTCLDESSLRVDGLGNATIIDVIFERAVSSTSTAERTSSRLIELRNEQETLTRTVNTLRAQSRVVDDFSRTLSAKDLNPSQFEVYLQMLGTKSTSFSKEIDDTNKRLNMVAREIGLEQKAGPDASKLLTKVTIVLFAKEPGPAEISLTYVVSNADWKPSYDLRVTMKSHDNTSDTVSVIYRAVITQTTGEDWNGVVLVLSSSSPSTTSMVPRLTKETIIAKGAPPPMRLTTIPQKSLFQQQAQPWAQMSTFGQAASSTFGQPAAAAAIPSGQKVSEIPAESLPSEDINESVPALLVMPTAAISDGPIGASFHVEGNSAIPSDGATHKVAINTLTLAAKIGWIAVPKLGTSAFLQCTIANTSALTLLRGSANVFLNDSFLAKTTIPYVTSQDTFTCSMGVDPSISIEYKPRTTQSSSPRAMYGVQLKGTVFEKHIKITNKRQTPIELKVRDQVPVSEDTKFKVMVLEPKELEEAPVRKKISVSPGVTCFWARKDWGQTAKTNQSDAQGPPSAVVDGQVEWQCDIAARQSCELLLSWEVTGAVGDSWTIGS